MENLKEKIKKVLPTKEEIEGGISNISSLVEIAGKMGETKISTIKLPDVRHTYESAKTTIIEHDPIAYIKRIRDDVERLKDWRITDVDPKILKTIFRIDNVILPAILEAAESAKNSMLVAKKAEEYAKNFIYKLTTAGKVLEWGVMDMARSAENLSGTFVNETGDLFRAYTRFGEEMYKKLKILSQESLQLGAEMVEFARETKPALDAAARNAKSASSAGGKLRGDITSALHDIEDLNFDKAADHLRDFRRHIDTFADDGMDAIAYLTYRGADGQGSVLLELVEGMGEVGKEAADMAAAFTGFATTARDETASLARENKKSFMAIRREIIVFANTFHRTLDDLKRVFTTQFTSEEIAKEMLIRENERKTYYQFMGDLKLYRQAENVYHDTNINIAITNEELAEAKQNLEQYIIQQDNKISVFRQSKGIASSFPVIIDETGRICDKYIDKETGKLIPISMETIETNGTQIDLTAKENEVQKQADSMAYRERNIVSEVGSVEGLRYSLRHRTSYNGVPFNGYYRDYQPKNEYGFPIPPSDVRDNVPSDISGKMYHGLTTRWSVKDNKWVTQNTLWWNTYMISPYDYHEFHYNMATIAYNEAKIKVDIILQECIAKLTQLECQKRWHVNIKNQRIIELESKLKKQIALLESSRINMVKYSNIFKTKWNIHPEESDLLTYQQIITRFK